MDLTQVISLVGSSTVLGIIITKAIDWFRDFRQGQLQARRAEVDKAISEKEKFRDRAFSAEKAERRMSRWARKLEESLTVHRIVIIKNLGSEHLPPEPTQEEE